MPATDVFAALSNPVRRTVLEKLCQRPHSAGELAQCFPTLGRSSISEHVTVLHHAGLVVEQVHGRQRIYHLDASGLFEVSDWIDPFRRYWRNRLDLLENALDQTEPS